MKNRFPNGKSLMSVGVFGVMLCGMTGTVQAVDILASGAVFGGPSQDHVACQVFNANNTPITILSTQIFSQNSLGGPLGLTFNNCRPSLAPNSICTFQTVADNQAFSCKVRIQQVKTNVRGTMSALNRFNTALSEADLR